MVYGRILIGSLILAASTVALTPYREKRQVGDGQGAVDYPTYSQVPAGLSFTCQDKIPGYYADPEAQCQVWHWCVPGGQKYSFLCPNQTLFNQIYRVCDWWYRVDCPGSPNNYDINQDLYRINEQTGNQETGLGRDLLGEESIIEENEASVTKMPNWETEQDEQMPEKKLEQMPEKTLEQMPEKTLEQMPEKTLEQMPEKALEQMPEQSLEQIPGKTMEQAPERTLEQDMPEQLQELQTTSPDEVL